MTCVREWQALGSDDSQPLEDAFLPQFLNFNFDNSLGEPYPWVQIPCAPSARCSPNYCRDSGCLTIPTTLYIYSTVPTRHATGTTYTAYRYLIAHLLVVSTSHWHTSRLLWRVRSACLPIWHCIGSTSGMRYKFGVG